MNQKFKDNLKKIPIIKKTLLKKNMIKITKIIKKNIGIYQNAFIYYSTSFPKENDCKLQRRIVIINSHIIEKGLSHTNFRAGFGKQNVIELQKNLINYIQSKDVDSFAINNAISLLHEYHRMNIEHGFDDSEYVDLSRFNSDNLVNSSPYFLKKDSIDYYLPFKWLSENRHSIRCYDEDGLPISNDLLNKAVECANTAPSACNRQATHLFVVKDRELFKYIENIHGGCKGFGCHVSAFIFVTSDLSLYSCNEVKLPVYDAGIYTMNLIYALQSVGLYSCVLNGSFPGEKMTEIREVTSIPYNYDINGLIAVYNLSDNSNLKIACSPRREANDTITFV